MSDVVIFDRWRVRRGTAADLVTVNETPLEGELVLETDTGRFKFGDGSTAWNDLAYSGEGAVSINAQTGTAYSADLVDADNVVTMDNAAANTFTVPANSSVSFPVGTTLEVWQKGAGQTTIVADTGVGILYDDTLTLALRGQDAGCSLRKVGTDTWRLVGLMEPTSSPTYVESVVAGTNVTVDATDPANPIISATGGGGGGGYAEGTSFPGSPSDDDKFYRTDLNLLCFYDGTRWLSCEMFKYDFPITNQAASGATGYVHVPQDFDIYVEDWNVSCIVNGTNNGSNYWTIRVDWIDAANAATVLATANTSASPGSAWVHLSAAVNAVLSSSAMALRINALENGAAGNLFAGGMLTYRLVVA